MKTAAFTIAPYRFLSQANALLRSLSAHSPGWDRFLVVLEDPRAVQRLDANAMQGRLIGLTDLEPAWRELAFKYDREEFAAAVKPAVFQELFRRSYESAIFFDPRGLLFAQPTLLDRLLLNAQAVLTPYITEPFEGNGPGHIPEQFIQGGAFTSGCVAFRSTPKTLEFLAYWRAALRNRCLLWEGREYSGDEGGLALAPCFLDHVAVLRSHAFSAAVWNLFQRPLKWNGRGAETRDGPLVFALFHGLLKDHRPEPNLRASPWDADTDKVVSRLVEHYREAVASEAGGLKSLALNPTFSLYADGSPISIEDRRKYWGLSQVERDEIGDPFAARTRLSNLTNLVPVKLKTFDQVLMGRQIAQLQSSTTWKIGSAVLLPARWLIRGLLRRNARM